MTKIASTAAAETDRGMGTSPATSSDARPLRVLVVTVSAGGIGGMQRHTHDLVRGLAETGHDVEVVCPAAEGLAPTLYGARWTLLEAAGRHDSRWSAQLLGAYREAMQRAPLDVVHSESTSAAPLARQGIVTPIVIAYHGNYLGLAKAHLRRSVTRPRSASRETKQLLRMTWFFLRDRNTWAFRRSDAIVVSRQQLRDTARSSRISEQQVAVVPNGVDVSVFRPGDRSQARRGLGIGDGLVLTVIGRLNAEKGFDVALKAFARIASDVGNVRLIVVGGGEERSALERLAQRLGVAARTEFVGPQPQERVADYLVASDAFLFPTRREEAGPIVLLQAMACGIPVVSSRIGGIGEVLELPDGSRAGLLIRPGSVSDLEAAVRRLIADPELRSSLGAAARERAVGEYSLETMVERTVAVYRAAIARGGQAL